jgi:hypothetical protein
MAFFLLGAAGMNIQPLDAAKLTGVSCLDRDHLLVTFIDGEVKFKDDGKGASAFGTPGFDQGDDWVVSYGGFDTNAAVRTGSWKIASPGDPAYAGGKNPLQVFRKSKINGMAQLSWDTPKNDFRYEAPLAHTVCLKLPAPLQAGKKYTLAVDPRLDPGKSVHEFVFDIFRSRSEAIHANLVGYLDIPSVKSADVFYWMGDGGARDYSAFTNAKVWVYDVASGEKHEAGVVKFWMKRGQDQGWYDLTASDVWTADFTGFEKPGTYRLAIDGIGCSRDFKIEKNAYRVPYGVTLRGFYYMRVGEAERSDIRPIPRQPLYIPGKSPKDTRVYLTTMQPYDKDWEKFAGGDQWDAPDKFAKYLKEGKPVNTNAWGGHADAADWDRHLGHVSIIYDMLLPYFLTAGALSDDDTGIAESGNGIPDLLDEARNEVDFWLRLRDGAGYSHGLSNPTKWNALYQAGPTTVAAWANAANAAMLADCFRIGGFSDLEKQYLRAAVTAYQYAEKQKDKQLDKIQGVGDLTMRGADFKMTAAAYLFDLTGDTRYEKAVAALSLLAKGPSDIIVRRKASQIWATAGYLFTSRKIGYPALRDRMRQCVIEQATKYEAGPSLTRPSRRATWTTDDDNYFKTSQNVHLSLLAHKLADDPGQKAGFLNALILEADWGLGRNPLNMILMTTASTPLSAMRSIENMFTSGRNDGTPGLHPGHTPYLNTDNWWEGMVMGKPRWMADQGYPEFARWPAGECYFDTRWVWAHSEFTPQQTMRGKMALYGYLYGISRLP